MLTRKCLLAMLILMLDILMRILMLLNLNTGYADTDADLCIRIMSLCCTTIPSTSSHFHQLSFFPSISSVFIHSHSFPSNCSFLQSISIHSIHFHQFPSISCPCNYYHFTHELNASERIWKLYERLFRNGLQLNVRSLFCLFKKEAQISSLMGSVDCFICSSSGKSPYW